MGRAPRFSTGMSCSPAISTLATPALMTLWGGHLPFAPEGEKPQRELSRPELFARICVSAPYFAPQEVKAVGRGEVMARLPVEPRPGAEGSPLPASEVYRHLSVLGACAASLVNPSEGPHCYLPRRAWVERLHEGPLPQATQPLHGSAKAEFNQRRTAIAHALLSDPEGQPLFAMGVDYNVLHAESFVRLFQGTRQDPRLEGPCRDPAVQVPLPSLRDVVREGECLRGTLGPVGPELCRGHFELFPVLPMAAVVEGLCGLAGTLLGQGEGQPPARYLVTRGDVRTESFAHAGETVRFDAHRLAVKGRDHYFDCWASVGGRVVAVMELTLTCLE
ncbi:hypothetical protein D187_001658 [Cystobacter fuscus DSM 2262]|uniref:MaoC-like domain-containing protein n=1 Tax=Cystobacter fuscus (strain ATCC 25194 / DSM 2262 / NBRC 100088 / M29) TaxID=1242864 RepID=S9PD54_CYSF2|nr:hypothetical protein [Cystobacter fuscus]EPX61006.1 hypothetical protein D187_001658 [Cystobacter fuscus DSM 2262]